MISIGIESTAHTFGVGIVDDKGKIYSDVRAVYKAPEGWGLKPAEVAEHHRKACENTFGKALLEAGLKITDIDIISFSQGPGLPPCLSAGLEFAKQVSRVSKIPLVGVNHCIAHIEIGNLLCGCKGPVAVFTSGANTQIISKVEGRHSVLGETQDIGLGNALDKFGRAVGIGFPAGPKIEEIAKGGSYIPLPYTVKGMDLAFAGLVTEAERQAKHKGKKLEDVCYSLQEIAFAMVAEVAERAMAHLDKEELLLTGGVAANSRLQEMLSIMCSERGAKFFACPKKYCGDNGAMIAWTGLLGGNRGEIEIKPRWRVDEF